VGNPEGKNHFGVDGRIILKWIFRSEMWVMDWVDVAQERDRWRVLVNAVMNIHKIKYGEPFDKLKAGFLLNKDSDLWSKCGTSKDGNFIPVRPVVHTIIRCREPTNSSVIVVLRERNFRLMNLNTYLLNY
jgi:hypothetical protein